MHFVEGLFRRGEAAARTHREFFEKLLAAERRVERASEAERYLFFIASALRLYFQHAGLGFDEVREFVRHGHLDAIHVIAQLRAFDVLARESAEIVVEVFHDVRNGEVHREFRLGLVARTAVDEVVGRVLRDEDLHRFYLARVGPRLAQKALHPVYRGVRGAAAGIGLDEEAFPQHTPRFSEAHARRLNGLVVGLEEAAFALKHVRLARYARPRHIHRAQRAGGREAAVAELHHGAELRHETGALRYRYRDGVDELRLAELQQPRAGRGRADDAEDGRDVEAAEVHARYHEARDLEAYFCAEQVGADEVAPRDFRLAGEREQRREEHRRIVSDDV